jgi:hypothetical protein
MAEGFNPSFEERKRMREKLIPPTPEPEAKESVRPMTAKEYYDLGAPEEPEINHARRKFSIGVGSLLVSSSVAAVARQAYEQDEKRKKEERERPVPAEYFESEGRAEAFKRSEHFSKKVKGLMKTLRESHLPGILEFGADAHRGIDGMSLIEYVDKHLMSGPSVEGIPHPVREEIRFLGLGIAAQESSYDPSAKNGDAISLFQFMPENLQKFGYRPEDMKDVRKQVECMNKFVAANYKELQKDRSTLDVLQERYFGSERRSHEQFLREYEALVLANSHIFGPDGMAEFCDWLREHRRLDAEAYDVMFLAGQELSAFNANHKGRIPRRRNEDNGRPEQPFTYLHIYKELSSEYIPRVYAFALLINEEAQKAKGKGGKHASLRLSSLQE